MFEVPRPEGGKQVSFSLHRKVQSEDVYPSLVGGIMQQTETYKLNLLEANHTFSVTPLNENMEKVEEVLQTLSTLQTEHAEELRDLASKGVKIVSGSYTRNDTYGSENSNQLTFEFKPYAVFLYMDGNGSYGGVCVRGVSYVRSYVTGDSMKSVKLTWSEDGVSWYNTDIDGGAAAYQLNLSSMVYHYVSIGLNRRYKK